MKIALSVSGDKVAPTFDFVDEFVIVEKMQGNTIRKQRFVLGENFALLRVKKLKGMNIDTILCGAISNPVVRMFRYYNISVISGVAGDIDNVIGEYLRGNSDFTKYRLPGFSGSGWCRQKMKRGYQG